MRYCELIEDVSDIWYHTSSIYFEKFERQTKNMVNGEYQNPIWLTKDKNLNYSRNGYMYTCLLSSTTRIFVASRDLIKEYSDYIGDEILTELGERLYNVLVNKYGDEHAYEIFYDIVHKMSWDNLGRVEVMEFIEKQGFDAYEEKGEGHRSIAVFNTDKIKIISVEKQ